MSVSYDRVMDVRQRLALAVSKRFAEDGVAVPSTNKRGVFTTGVDNIDESGRIELHGTAISLTNHLTHDNMGEDPPPPPWILMKIPLSSFLMTLPLCHKLMNMLEKLLFHRFQMEHPGQLLLPELVSLMKVGSTISTRS